MQGILFILILAIATLFSAYFFALMGLAIAGFAGVFNNLPEWTWAGILFVLTLATWRGLRYSPD